MGNKLTKLQLDYLKQKLSKIVNQRMENHKRPNQLYPQDKISMIKDGVVSMKSITDIHNMVDCDKWYNIYDFTEIEKKINEGQQEYDNTQQKLKDEAYKILDKVILSGLDIDQAIKNLEDVKI